MNKKKSPPKNKAFGILEKLASPEITKMRAKITGIIACGR